MKIQGKSVVNLHSRQELEAIWSPRFQQLSGDISVVQAPTAQGARTGRLRTLTLLVAAAIVFAICLRPAIAGSQEYGTPRVPDFSALANDGQTYSPDNLKGNVVLIMFWETWCPYCRRAMPHMNALADEYSNAQFTLLGVCGSKDPAAWHDYIAQHHLRWPQYLDKGLQMAHLFGAHGVPNFFLVDKDGYLVAHWVGWDDSLTGQVGKLIDHTLARPRRQ